MNKRTSSENEIFKLLSTGDLRTIGNVKIVITKVRANKTRLRDLIKAISHDDDRLRMRAFDALEKLSAEDPAPLNTYKKLFLEIPTQIKQKEVLWHWCQIMPRLRLTERERERVFSTMNSLRGSKSKIVWTFALQGMFDLALLSPKLKPELIEALSEDLSSGSAAVKARCRKLILRCQAAARTITLDQ